MTKRDGQPTPTPWKYEASTKTIRATPANYWIATVDSWDGMVNNEKDGEFIVRAVNHHDRLLKSLAQVLEIVDSGDRITESHYGTEINQWRSLIQAIKGAV